MKLSDDLNPNVTEVMRRWIEFGILPEFMLEGKKNMDALMLATDWVLAGHPVVMFKILGGWMFRCLTIDKPHSILKSCIVLNRSGL